MRKWSAWLNADKNRIYLCLQSHKQSSSITIHQRETRDFMNERKTAQTDHCHFLLRCFQGFIACHTTFKQRGPVSERSRSWRKTKLLLFCHRVLNLSGRTLETFQLCRCIKCIEILGGETYKVEISVENLATCLKYFP